MISVTQTNNFDCDHCPTRRMERRMFLVAISNETDICLCDVCIAALRNILTKELEEVPVE